MLAFAPLEHDVSASATTFAAAKIIVAALAANDTSTAVAKLAEFTGDDLILVGNKAIALGADPDTVKMLVDSLGGGTSEVIEVTGEAPILKKAGKFPWLLFVLLIGTGAVGYTLYQRRKRA